MKTNFKNAECGWRAPQSPETARMDKEAREGESGASCGAVALGRQKTTLYNQSPQGQTMNQHPPSDARACLHDFRARGIVVEIVLQSHSAGAGTVVGYDIQMTGGRKQAGDWDRVKRFKRGLVELLKSEGAYGLHLSDFQESSKVLDAFDPFGPKPSKAPRYRAKAGDDEMCVTLTTSEPVFRPLDESKPRLREKAPNWSIPLPKAKRVAANQGPTRAGDRFGKWLVLEEAEERTATGCVQFKCRCDCGNERLVSGGSLRRSSGASRSCGCMTSPVPKANWATVDYSLSDKELATRYNCGVPTVQMNRRKFQKDAPKARQFFDWESVDWSLPNPRIQELMGCGKSTVRDARRRFAPP